MPIAVRHLFTYRLGDGLSVSPQRGQRVLVPFKKSFVVGYLAGVHATPFEGEVKDVKEIVDSEPLIGEEAWQLAEWMASYYGRSLGETLDLFFPTLLRGGWKRNVHRERKRKSKVPSEFLLKPTELPSQYTVEQTAALNIMLPAARERRFAPFLVHGITGSGKTILYVEMARAAVQQGRGVVVLVPEIGLTSHVARHFVSAFPDRVALLHSKLTSRRRWDEWDRIRSGQADVVVGARSALFAPLKDVGLIVADEEHDHAYKQEDGVTYHARDVALVMGQRWKAPVVLGSATPSLESHANASRGKYRLIRLARRVSDRPLPDVDVVDMRFKRNPDKRLSWLSPQLHKAMVDTLERRGQVVLFLNRRGFAPVLRCMDCGEGVKCPHCDITLTYHKADRHMRCHYCDHRQDLPEVCSECKSTSVAMAGAGTQKIEEDIRALFPQTGIARLDMDTAQSKKRRFEIMEGMESGAIQIAVGTQMITKGYHYPQITLVGVVDADLGLFLPDFRSAERTYQQILQAAGRAGRGEQKGRVFIQTMSPDHHAIDSAKHYDESRFYETELRLRRQWGYPPYKRLAMIRIRARHEVVGGEGALAVLQATKQMAGGKGVEVLGPAPAPLYRLRGHYRWQILLKADTSKGLHEVMEGLLDAKGPRRAGYEVRLDVDPVNML